MKKNEIQVGKCYKAKVNGRLVTVKVNRIQHNAKSTSYHVTNLSTGRSTVFHSAQKFQREAHEDAVADQVQHGGERQPSLTPADDRRVRQIEEKYSTKQGATEAERQEAQEIVEGKPRHEFQIGEEVHVNNSRDSSRIMAFQGPLAIVEGVGSVHINHLRKKASTPTASILRQAIADNEQRKALRASVKANDKAPHVIVEARAGTGKTTTLIEGLKRVKGLRSTLTPSPQQAAVWDAMEQSKGKAETICFVAFNKSIATELQNRVPSGCSAMTMHSMGYAAVRKAFGNVKVTSWRVQDIISELMERDIRELRKYRPTLVKATEDLVSLCKMNLAHRDPCGNEIKVGDPDWPEVLGELAAHYDIDLNGDARDVFDLVPRVLDACRDVASDGRVDFDDMVWLPVALNLPLTRYDLLLVDEAQDLNRCQQALAKRAGDRLVLCGDPKQAIYGFAGADSRSMARMEEELAESERSCVRLPLTVTRRCGKAIVAEAQTIVPDFEAFETNGEGKISSARYEGADAAQIYGKGGSGKDAQAAVEAAGGLSYTAQVQDNDMILCRVNAPLVSQCFRFLKAGRKANIQGRDVGQGLISTIKKLKANDISELMAKLSDWHHKEVEKENRKRNPNEQRLIALQDRYDCLCCFIEEAKTIEAVITRIEMIFTDDRNGKGIKLSSVHKAKGLESRRVFILLPKGASMPHPMARSEWQVEQEMNLKYVAITRAIEELVWVTE